MDQATLTRGRVHNQPLGRIQLGSELLTASVVAVAGKFSQIPRIAA